MYEIVRDGTRYYPLFDGVGSVTTLTDATGAAVGRVRYSAFGVPQSSGVTENAVSFTGHQFDAATGLVYARARYYDPTLGRFLSQDPEPAINPYVYASNAPVDKVDPTGRSESAEYAEEDTFVNGRTVGDRNTISRVTCYFHIFGLITGLFTAVGEFPSPADQQLADEIATRICQSLYGPPGPLP